MAYADPLDPRNREARMRHYEKNKPAYQARARERDRRLQSMIRELKTAPCLDCWVAYPWYVMDFDHRPGEAKVMDVGIMVRRGLSEAKIRAEIAKCDVVCANCHRERTFSRLSLAEDPGVEPGRV